MDLRSNSVKSGLSNTRLWNMPGHKIEEVIRDIDNSIVRRENRKVELIKGILGAEQFGIRYHVKNRLKLAKRMVERYLSEFWPDWTVFIVEYANDPDNWIDPSDSWSLDKATDEQPRNMGQILQSTIEAAMANVGGVERRIDILLEEIKELKAELAGYKVDAPCPWGVVYVVDGNFRLEWYPSRGDANKDAERLAHEHNTTAYIVREVASFDYKPAQVTPHNYDE